MITALSAVAQVAHGRICYQTSGGAEELDAAIHQLQSRGELVAQR
ncbi:MAG: hypothetical protein ABSD39_20290 [Terriglobales bacterium]